MKALIVDLNNFSRYPTLSVGYISAVLRQHQVDVDVLSPFSFGVHGFPRNVREKPWQLYANFLNHWSAVTRIEPIKNMRGKWKKYLQPGGGDDTKIILRSVLEMLERKPDVVLISAYTMYIDVCRKIGALCDERDIPVMVGGNSFVIEEIAELWSKVKGISAVYAGEPEFDLYEMVRKLSQQQDISHYPGVYAPAKTESCVAKPLQDIDRVPFPDFSDFPWHAYPNRIVPIMTGRGCEWGRCTFCSDVLTSAGRTFRSRSLDNVLHEIELQRSRFDVSLFVFLDLKLNSDLELWRGLAHHLPRIAPGIKWTASVHVDSRHDNGLSKADLKKAAEAGLVRITCGLESGSTKVLNSMAKGVKLKRMREYIKAAYDAGISVRLTCIIGYPTEEAEDIDLTTRFIEENGRYIERISLNRFANAPGTPVTAALQEQGDKYPHIKVHNLDKELAIIPHDNQKFAERKNLVAVFKLIRAVNRINRKPILECAREFEGAF